jgi:hypothetical protein
VIYFVQIAEFVKIGHVASDAALKGRLCSLQGSTPFEAVLLATTPGSVENERWLHEKFAHLHHRREWFRAGSDLMALIGAVTRNEPVELGERRRLWIVSPLVGRGRSRAA